MFNYQHTYMDEKDLAEHEFRQQTSSGRTINEYLEGDSQSIYDAYKDQMEQEKELPEFERIKKEMLEEKKKA